MTKEKLIEIIRVILKVDCDLDFLLRLEQRELETLAAFTGSRMLWGREREAKTLTL
jgi:hypothetical protein